MTRANVKWWVVAGVAFFVALASALWWLRPEVEVSGDGEAPAVKARGARTSRAPRRKGARPASAVSKRTDGGSVADEPGDSGTPVETPQTEEDVQADAEEKLVDAFDDMTDKWREPSEADVPMEVVEKFRQQFNKIPQARKTECLQRALNLLPDENVMLLAGILLDKSQPKEYLELVYNDILNRDESVKKPLLREIFKDREHPCWANTAWILDVTGEMPRK